jgi:cysteine synthase A
MGRKYQSIVETIGNTPVVRINRLGPRGVNLFVKIEAFNPLGSVKDRLALGVIETAEKSGELKPGQTVIEATSGNTGIGLAMVCAAKGYPLVITMAEPFSVERRKLNAVLRGQGHHHTCRRTRRGHDQQDDRACQGSRLVHDPAVRE